MGQGSSVASGNSDTPSAVGTVSVLKLASDHVWMYDHSDEEVVSDSELNEGMWLSDSGSDDDDEVASASRIHEVSTQSKIKNHISKQIKKVRKVRTQHASTEAKADEMKRARRADTNVLCVKYNKLTQPSNVHAGDVVTCSNVNCTAVLSYVSKVVAPSAGGSEGGHKVWTCEFCGTKNNVDIVPEEVPMSPDTTYLIAPPLAGQDGASMHGGNVDDTLAVFCIDVSGSMCVTTEVPGKFKVKGSDQKAGSESFDTDGSDQYLPGQRRDVTYVSRLQCVKDAVDKQLSALSKEHPERRAVLITFSDEVTVTGDSKGDVITVAGDKLSSPDELVKIGTEVPIPAAIKLSYEDLKKKLFGLEEGGQTALGPALLIATTLAGRVSGSKVIICTDGLANKGVGNLEVDKGKEAKDVQAFYENLGALALGKGVTVSLLTIQGSNCSTANLGQVADKTRGECISVDPLSITKEVNEILGNEIVATNVKVKIILHRELYFRTEDSNDNVLNIPVGNATFDTEFMYEYGTRAAKRKAKQEPKTDEGGALPEAKDSSMEVPPIEIDGKPHLPFQIQIEYTLLDGAKYMRVLTEVKPVTYERETAEMGMDLAILGKHIANTTAKLTMEGEFTQARVNAIVGQRLIEKHSHTNTKARAQYNALMSDIIPLENALRDRQQEERREYGGNLSDCSGGNSSDEEREEIPVPVMKVKVKKRKVQRRTDMSDNLANFCYQVKGSSSTAYGVDDAPDV